MNCSYRENKLTIVKVVQFRSDLDNSVFEHEKAMRMCFFCPGKKNKSKFSHATVFVVN